MNAFLLKATDQTFKMGNDLEVSLESLGISLGIIGVPIISLLEPLGVPSGH